MKFPLSKIVSSTAQALLVGGALCGLAGCGSMSSSSSTTTTPVTTTPPDVYAAGIETIGTQTKAAVWKNGTETVLDSGSYSAQAASVAVANGHVYVAGTEVGPSGNDEAVLWDNGVATHLPITGVIGYASGVIVLGTDVYVAGNDETPTSTPGVNTGKAALWKNGVESILPDAGNGGAQANAIATDGTNVFVGGGALTLVPSSSCCSTLVQTAVLWRNGALYLAGSGTTIQLVTSMTVANGDTYLAGALCSLPLPDCTAAAYWKNGSTFPQTPAVFSSATGIAFSGGNLYLSENLFPAATANNTAVLVTNGSITTLAAATGAAANSVVTYNGDVFVGGALNSRPTYWKNGQPVTLTTAAKVASLTAMTVVPAGT